MKFIIRQFLLALLLILIINESQCQKYVRKNRLSHLITKIGGLKEKKSRDNDESKLFKSFDMNCVKNFLKYPQSDKIIINEEEDMIFIVGALLKCTDEDTAFKFIFDELIRSKLQKWYNCFEWHLQRLEPDSKLIENVTISDIEVEKCKKEIAINEIKELERIYVDYFGPLDEYSCGAVTGADDYIKFVAKGVVMKFGNRSEELVKAETEKLKEYLKHITFTTADCIISRFEKDPKGFLKNDTLTYYFEDLTSSGEIIDDPGFKETSDILTKIIDSIDLDCTKQELNLSENGDVTLLKVEAKILIGSAMSKCIKTSQYDFANLLFDYGIESYEKSEENVYCANYNLQKLKPESKLVKNSTVKPDLESSCEDYSYISIYPFTSIVNKYEDSVGKLENTSCGTISKELVRLFSFEVLLVAVEKDKELKRNGIKELFALVNEKLPMLADCVIQRLK